MIKLVFFDIDGTLIPFSTGKLPASAKRAIKKLRDNGIKCFIATGKSLAMLTKMSVMEAEFDGYITLNGQLCYDNNLKLFFGYPIDPREMQVLEKIFDVKKIPFALIGEFSLNIIIRSQFTLTN